MPGDVNQIADAQLPELGKTLRLSHLRSECDSMEIRRPLLFSGIAWKQDSKRSVHFGYETAAITTVVIMTPSIAFTDEFETLTDQIASGCRQRGVGSICAAWNQYRFNVQLIIVKP
jgi:hypothetical protein